MPFNSVYEMNNPLTTVRNQHFWEWFSGDAVNLRWTLQDVAGTGSKAINDIDNSGARISSGATSANESHIDFNNVEQFDNADSTVIAVFKAVSTADAASYVGLKAAAGLTYITNSNDSMYAVCDSAQTYFTNMNNNSGNTQSTTVSTVPIDSLFHAHKLVSDGTDIKYTIDGILQSTYSGVNQPALKLQPTVGVKTTTSSAKSTDVSYLEAYNN